MYAVGDLYITTRAGNPATLLGYGTWAAFGDGRFLLSGATAGVTAGSATHTHAAHSGVLQHNHGVTDPGHVHAQMRLPTATGGATSFTVDTSMSGTPATTRPRTCPPPSPSASGSVLREARPDLRPWL
jgi:hypothetical protein